MLTATPSLASVRAHVQRALLYPLAQTHTPSKSCAGNPIYGDMSTADARVEVLRHVPQVAKIDGDMVKPSEREAAGLEVLA
jgi:hypothetical protein